VIHEWLRCDSLITRAAKITSTLELDGSVSGSATFDNIVVNDSSRNEGTLRQKGEATFGATATPVVISTAGKLTAADTVRTNTGLKIGNPTPADQQNIAAIFTVDADADASAITKEQLTLTLVPNATPTSAYWTLATSQMLGIKMPNMGIGGGNPTSDYYLYRDVNNFWRNDNWLVASIMYAVSYLTTQTALIVNSRTGAIRIGITPSSASNAVNTVDVTASSPVVTITDIDVNKKYSSYAQTTDTTAIELNASGAQPIIGLASAEGDKWQVSIDNDDKAQFSGASGGYLFDETVEAAANNGNAAKTLFKQLNNDETSTGETAQTIDNIFEFKGTKDDGSSYTNQEAGKLSWYKINDYFHASDETDQDAGLKLYTVTDGAYKLNSTWSDDDLTVAGDVASANYGATNKLTTCTTNAGALDYSAASKTLTVEDDATVSQDMTSDASPSFTGLTLSGDLSANTHSIDANEAIVLPAPGTLTDGQYAGARIITLTAGYGNTAIGELVYLNNDDSKFEKTDGNAAATAADVLVGIVLEVKAEDAACKVLLEGTITVDAWNWATVGASLWISGTAGEFTQTRLAVANDIVRIMGYALDDDTIYFCPDNIYVTVE